ncbi:alginate lyase family protein [Paenibacillus sp. YN15]|uniref:alginate lyase family protein n=1 Tax=Paenibacillus sp. YN15 TaxID=1742774 RepID=UPI000DCE6016|nr:alginate lyase family protein [Paenibacillus sp. YN15]RAV05038.1 hypothetical protein DQG13_03920 [Paenibacillus sp. YN15]
MNSSAAVQLVLREAEAGMAAPCHAVPVWSIPGYYLDAAGHTAAKRLMEEDAQNAYAAALAYRITGKPAYADKTVELLNGWAAVNREVADHDGPLVSAYLGVGLIKAAELVKGYSGWSGRDREQFIHWLTAIFLPGWDGIPGRNNWWSWSLYAQLTLFQFMGDSARFAEEAANLKEQIDSSIAADGFLPEETVRGKNGIWYHYFALAPLTAAAKLVLDTTGEDLFHWISPGGKSLKLALDTLFYFIDGRVDQWPFEADQNFPKPLAPHAWPLDLYEAMAGVYRDPEYERLVSPCRPIAGHKNSNSGFYVSHAWIYPTWFAGEGK